jgi:imidazolonepropionase-like amidohydrolase
MTGGHGAWIGREADGPDDVRKAVREQLKAGADCIKLIATGGVMTPGVEPGAQQLTDEELSAGVEEAHKAGRRAAAHAHGSAGINAAVRAGIDSIEHGSFMTDESIDLMKRHGTFFSVTLCSSEGFFKAPPDSVAEWAMAKAMRVRAAMDDSFRRAYAAGVRLVLGTDAGTPYNRHGDNAREMALMVKLGAQPLDALRAGTRNGAELLGKLDEIGTIEAGKLADLVLCRGDAVADVGRLCTPDNVRLVVQGGRVVRACP